MEYYGAVRLLFVIKPPADEDDHKQFDEWLSAHGMENADSQQYPFLLSAAKFSGAYDQWEEEMLSMNVDVYSEQRNLTDAPEELVYVLGRPDYEKGCERAQVKYVKWLRDYVTEHGERSCGLGDAKKMESGNKPVCLGRIIVRNTRDREPLIQEIEAFGPVRLEFIDIRNPWVD